MWIARVAGIDATKVKWVVAEGSALPSLLANGQPLIPEEMQAYYRVPLGADATAIEAPPNGLEMIAGDGEATGAQDPETVAWSCGLAKDTSPVPVPCEQSPFLLLRLRFDPCWDGTNLGSSDHRSHLAALGSDGTCPEDHPVLNPQLQVEIRYPSTPAGTALTLASGPATGGHGDALVAWDRDHVEDEVKICLRHNRKCDVTSEAVWSPATTSSTSARVAPEIRRVARHFPGVQATVQSPLG